MELKKPKEQPEAEKLAAALEDMNVKSGQLREEWQAAHQREQAFLAWIEEVKQEAESLTPGLVDDPIGVTVRQAGFLELLAQAETNKHALRAQVVAKKSQLEAFDGYRSRLARRAKLES